MNYIGYKIELYPDEAQKKFFNMYFGAYRFAFNYCVGLCVKKGQEKEEKYDYSVINTFELINSLGELKHTEGYEWMNQISSYTITAAARAVGSGNDRYMRHLSKHPNFKRKHDSNQLFAVRAGRLQIFEDEIHISSGRGKDNTIGRIKCCIPPDCLKNTNTYKGFHPDKKYMHCISANISLRDDGKYYLSLLVEQDRELDLVPNISRSCINNEDWVKRPHSEILGIDLGFKDNNWMQFSDGKTFCQPDTKKLERKVDKLQRDYKRKTLTNDKKYKLKTQGLEKENVPKRQKSKNEIETLERLRNTYKKITNKREHVIYEAINYVIKEKKAEAVVLETLSASSMIISNPSKHNAKYTRDNNRAVKAASPYKVRTMFEQAANSNDIPFILAPKTFESTQICSNCGNKQKIGKKRTYVCPVCGFTIDRDLNASINLSNYGYEVLHPETTSESEPNLKPKPFVIFG